MQIEGIRGVSVPYVPAVTQSSAAAEERLPPEQPSRASQLPYISPVLQYDSDAAVAVLLFRDGGNGDVENQYPSKRVVREYQLRGREVASSDGSSSSEERAGSQRLLSLARGNIEAISASLPSGFGSAGSPAVSPTVAASPTVSIAGGGNVVGTVNFVA